MGTDQESAAPQELQWESTWLTGHITSPSTICPLFNEAIIALCEASPKGVIEQKEADYPYSLLPSLLINSKHLTKIRYQHIQGGQLLRMTWD